MTASTQSSVPTFDGSDGADAEEFIGAIRSKAFSEGRDDDDAWVLRLIKASLTGDALRWHTNLDPTIRNDLDLLEKALLARFCPPFKGTGGAECERFLYSLHRRAFEEGKVDDNEWITKLVASYVAEDALRWYLGLTPEVRGEWELLEKAMLARYPPPEVRARGVQSHTANAR